MSPIFILIFFNSELIKLNVDEVVVKSPPFIAASPAILALAQTKRQDDGLNYDTSGK